MSKKLQSWPWPVHPHSQSQSNCATRQAHSGIILMPIRQMRAPCGQVVTMGARQRQHDMIVSAKYHRRLCSCIVQPNFLPRHFLFSLSMLVALPVMTPHVVGYAGGSQEISKWCRGDGVGRGGDFEAVGMSDVLERNLIVALLLQCWIGGFTKMSVSGCFSMKNSERSVS